MLNVILAPLVGVAIEDSGLIIVGALSGNSRWQTNFDFNTYGVQGSQNQIYRGRIRFEKKLLWIGPTINYDVTNQSYNAPQEALPFDAFSGGILGLDDFVMEVPVISGLVNIVNNFYGFIPVVSALDIKRNNGVVNSTDYFKKYAGGSTPEPALTSGFHNFIVDYNEGNPRNNEHVSFQFRNGNWLAEELEVDENAPVYPIFDCSFICANDAISGPSNICTSGSYAVPPGATSYIWSRSGSGSATLTSNGNTATLTRNGQQTGMVTITVRISSPNCSTSDIILSKEVWVGTLKYNSLSNVTSGLNQHISPLPANGCGTNGFEVNFWPSNDLVQEVQFEKITTDVYWHRDFVTDTSRNVFLFPECNKPFQFKVRARNNCGWSEWFELSYTIESCPEDCIPPFNGIIGTNFILAPNPVTNGTLNVSVKSDAPWFTVPGGGGDPSLDPDENGGGSGGLLSNIRVSISIYNQLGILVQSYPSTLMPATLDISTLPAGSYLFVFQYMTQTESHTIIKQ